MCDFTPGSSWRVTYTDEEGRQQGLKAQIGISLGTLQVQIKIQ